MSGSGSNSDAPFHKLLNYYSSRSSTPDTQTIRFYDSLTGHLAIGLDFPAAFAIALGRHIYLRNGSNISFLNIHVPDVARRLTPLDGVQVDEKADYSRAEVMEIVRQHCNSSSPEGGVIQSLLLQAEAMGLWSLAADVHTHRLSGADFVAFQRGSLLQSLAQRRVDRSQVLPLWRGGPISVAGHSWFVWLLFGVQVYLDDPHKKRN